MLDWNKPLQTRGGERVAFVGGPLPKAAVRKLVGSGEFRGHETHVYEIDGKFFGTDSGGYYYYGGSSDESEMDLVNSPEPHTSEFRTFSPDRTPSALGAIRCPDLDRAMGLISCYVEWDGVLEIIREGEQVVDVKFHSKAAE